MSYSEREFLSINSEGFHRVVYTDWGPEDGNPIIGIHGLTCNGGDFQVLAEDLIKHGHRFIAMDLPGRGRSDFLPNPNDYNYNQYWQDIMALLAHLDLAKPDSVDFLGVSLGGLLGMRLAGMEMSPIKRLIINDVGPEVPQDALDFIYNVIKEKYIFATIPELEQKMRETRGLTWGPLSDEHWYLMAENNARALDDGNITYAYDPEIARIFENEPIGAYDLWSFWNAITCPTLLIRGADSVILPQDITTRMLDHRENVDFVEFKGCGHVPSLMAPDQISIIQDWLKQ